MRYLLIDSNNLFNRAIHVTNGSAEMRAGMALHIILMSIAHAWRLFNADHVVVALECRNEDNWRKRYDKRYKLNRVEVRQQKTQKETETDAHLYKIYNEYIEFLKEKTNVTVLRCPIAEADDVIAYWTQKHPNDDHIIVSSDKDFRQLVSENVVIFNGIDKKLVGNRNSHLLTTIMLEQTKNIIKEIDIEEDPEYFLFEKIIRGDLGDNVFSAFPGVRKKPAKGKPGIIPAYNDRHNKGYDWNTFMLQRWVDEKQEEHVVKVDFERNKILIDLTQQPDDVKTVLDQMIDEVKEPRTNIGFHFFKFCDRYGLEKLSEKAEELSTILSTQRNAK